MNRVDQKLTKDERRRLCGCLKQVDPDAYEYLMRYLPQQASFGDYCRAVERAIITSMADMFREQYPDPEDLRRAIDDYIEGEQRRRDCEGLDRQENFFKRLRAAVVN
jgi:hypothetical protein